MVFFSPPYSMLAVSAFFPAGFQPGVTHTKLKVSFSADANAAQVGNWRVEFDDSLGNPVGIDSAAYMAVNTVTTTFTLTDTGDPFVNGYTLTAAQPNQATPGGVVTFTTIEFS